MKLITLISIIPFIHMAVTDFRTYHLSMVSILMATIAGIIRLLFLQNGGASLLNVTLNLMFTIIIIGVLLLYSKIRRFKLTQSFAIGDIVFLFLATLFFSPLNYILFIIVSSILGLLFFFLKTIYHSNNKLVPLAGVMSANLMAVLIIELIIDFSAYSDIWIIQNML